MYVSGRNLVTMDFFFPSLVPLRGVGCPHLSAPLGTETQKWRTSFILGLSVPELGFVKASFYIRPPGHWGGLYLFYLPADSVRSTSRGLQCVFSQVHTFTAFWDFLVDCCDFKAPIYMFLSDCIFISDNVYIYLEIIMYIYQQSGFECDQCMRYLVNLKKSWDIIKYIIETPLDVILVACTAW